MTTQEKRPPVLSFWEKELMDKTPYFIIIGSGLVGLWMAYHLKTKYPNYRIVILEKESRPTGASTRNAGFACFGSVTELVSDLEQMSESQMLNTVEMRYKGISMVREILGDHYIDYQPCGGYECLTLDSVKFAGLNGKLHLLNEKLAPITGTPETFSFCKGKKINQFEFTGFTDMIENKLEGGLHSGKLVKTLIQKVIEMGVTVINGIEVSGWFEEGNSVSVTTYQNITFSARQVFVCTGGFIGDLTSELPIKPARGQIIITSDIHSLPFTGTFHFNNGFTYFRNVGNKVLLGGMRDIDIEGEKTTQMYTSRKIQSKLEIFLQEHILHGRQYSIKERWSGIMSFNKEKKPMVYNLSKRVKSIHCCNGMGVATAPAFTEIVAKNFHL